MTTKPKHTPDATARDALIVHAAATADLADKRFAEHVDRHDLTAFAASIAKLQAGTGGRTHRLDAQVHAGVHVQSICAALADVCRAVRDEAELLYLADAAKRDESLARAFGWGRTLDPSSVSSVEGFAHALLAAASEHPHEAVNVHLDRTGLHHVHDLLTALEGADVAHVQRKADRHDATTALDSLAHAVSAESAHIRFVAKRVFRGDEAKLARYASTLPRHEVHHRTRHAPPPATPSTPGGAA